MKLTIQSILLLLCAVIFQGCSKNDVLTKQAYEGAIEIKAYVENDDVILERVLPVIDKGIQQIEYIVAKKDASYTSPGWKEETGLGVTSKGKESTKIADFIDAHGEGVFYYIASYRVEDESGNELLKGELKTNSFTVKK